MRLSDLGRGRYPKGAAPHPPGPTSGRKRWSWHYYYVERKPPPLLEFMPMRKAPVNTKPPDEKETVEFVSGWKAHFPTLAAARNDPKSFWMAGDFAADMLGCTREQFYSRYLRTGRLPYIVRQWLCGDGRTRRAIRCQKAFVPRTVVQELVIALLSEHARKGPNLAKKKMTALHGVDAVAKRLYPEAPVITGHDRHEPRFVGPRQYRLKARRRRTDYAIRTEDAGSGGQEQDRDREIDSPL